MQAMLTKEDLEQIGKIVGESRDDLKGDFRYLNQRIDRLDTKIDGVEQRLLGKMDDVMKHVDGFAKNQLKFEAELAAHQAAHARLGSSPTGA